MWKLTLSLVSIIILSGCMGPNMKYNGSGSYRDLLNARNQCAAHDPCHLRFDSCVAAKGFYRSPNGHLDASNMKIWKAAHCNAGRDAAMQKLSKDLIEYSKPQRNRRPVHCTTSKMGTFYDTTCN